MYQHSYYLSLFFLTKNTYTPSERTVCKQKKKQSWEVENCWPEDYWRSVQPGSWTRNYVTRTDKSTCCSEGTWAREVQNWISAPVMITWPRSLLLEYPLPISRKGYLFEIYNFVNEKESRKHGGKNGSRTLLKDRVFRSLSSFSFR